MKVDVSGTECESINSSLNITSKVANELVVKLDFAFSFQLARSQDTGIWLLEETCLMNLYIDSSNTNQVVANFRKDLNKH